MQKYKENPLTVAENLGEGEDLKIGTTQGAFLTPVVFP